MKHLESKTSKLFKKLKEEVQSGKYARTRTFPSEVALSRRFGVSRSLITNVVRELEREGLVSRSQGRATLVTRKGSSRKIGLIVPGVAVTEFFKPVMSEINRLSREAGYELSFNEVWSEVREERIAQVRAFAAEFVDDHVEIGEASCAAEHEVFEEVGKACTRRVFVAGTGTVEQVDGDKRSGGVAVEQHPEPIVQHVV